MSSSYQVPFIYRIYRRILRVIFKIIFRLLGRVKLEGIENIPSDESYIIAMNHVSILEVPFVGAFWPDFPEIIGAADVWNRPGQALLARMYHGLPVRRGEYDRKVLELVINVLQSGKKLLIAPEGTRSHAPGMQRGKPGIAYIADKAQVLIVPLGIVGTTEDYIEKAFKGQRPLIEMRVGEPFHLPPVKGRGAERREKRQQNADIVMAHIAAVLPPEYRGVYSDFEKHLGL